MTSYTIPTLETERLILRRPIADDAARATEFWMSDRAEFVGGQQLRYRAWNAFAAMLGHWEMRGFGLWAVTEKGNDTILGMVGPYYPDGWPERELGWVLFDGAEGKGIAFEATHTARDDARTRLGWTQIVSYIAHGNDRSVALAKRLGAELDADAFQPNPEKPSYVYRHPLAEGVA